MAVLAFITALITLLIKGYAVIATCLCVIYPGLLSIRSIESKSVEDDKIWLTYWIVYGAFHVLDTFIPFILNIIPYSNALRAVLFLWLIKFDGAEFIYKKYICDFLNNHRDEIKAFI